MDGWLTLSALVAFGCAGTLARRWYFFSRGFRPRRAAIGTERRGSAAQSGPPLLRSPVMDRDHDAFAYGNCQSDFAQPSQHAAARSILSSSAIDKTFAVSGHASAPLLAGFQIRPATQRAYGASARPNGSLAGATARQWQKWFTLLKINATLGPIVTLMGLMLTRG